MRILGIETSCDDTAIGIVNYRQRRFTIEAQVAASQVLLHRKYGGVVPEVAAREHAVTILPTMVEAMRRAKVGWKQIDAVAVTGGPGLNTALLVGTETARTIGYARKKPIVRVNHIEGHIAANWIDRPEDIRFPAIALVVSGGHTELILMRSLGSYQLIGRTLDDAVGEAFDKVAKMLGLPYPGGPSIAKQALLGKSSAHRFPLALLGKNNLDFSYAGLKTSVLYTLQKLPKKKSVTNDVAASFQSAASDQLVIKAERALKRYRAKTFLLAGGVAANALLRERLAQMIEKNFPGVIYKQPPFNLCTDNGVMIAMAGAFQAEKKRFTPWQKLSADPGWDLV